MYGWHNVTAGNVVPLCTMPNRLRKPLPHEVGLEQEFPTIKGETTSCN
jgi:hypothetical protein